MNVLFQGGGPAQGLIQNCDPDLNDQFRVADATLMAEGRAAFYQLGEVDQVSTFHTVAAAYFIGYKPCAASLLTFTTEPAGPSAPLETGDEVDG